MPKENLLGFVVFLLSSARQKIFRIGYALICLRKLENGCNLTVRYPVQTTIICYKWQIYK